MCDRSPGIAVGGESFPLRIDVLGAEPGLYTFHVEAIAVVGGSTVTLRSPPLTLAAPDPQRADQEIQVLSSGPAPDLAGDLLNLSPESFRALAHQFAGQYPRASKVSQILRKDFINDHNQGTYWNGYRRFPDVMHAAFRNDITYMRLMAYKGEAGTAVSLIQEFLDKNPDSEIARRDLVFFLMDDKRQDEARRVANDFLRQMSASPHAYVALARIDPKTDYLAKAIALAPQEMEFYALAAVSHIAHKKPLPGNFLTNLKHLSEKDRQQLLITTIQQMYLLNFGLDYDTDDMSFLMEIDPHAKMIFNFLPEASQLYRHILKRALGPSAHQITIDDRSLPLLVDLLLSVGRLRLAQYYARQISGEYLARSYGAACDFDSLVAMAEKTLDESISPTEYILYGIAMVERQNWTLFDKFIDTHSKTYPNQTNLVRAVYNEAKGRHDTALVQLFTYNRQATRTFLSQYRTGNALDPLEVRLVTDIRSMDRLTQTLFSLKDRKDTPIGPLVLDSFFSSDGSMYTYWPREYELRNRVGGYGIAYFSYQLSKYLELPDSSLVRIPNMAVSMTKEMVDQIGPFEGLSLSKVQDANKANASLFRRGIYGKRLSEAEIQNSYLLHLAWYYYWNEGQLDSARQLLDRAIKREERFYDALVLRARIHFVQGAADQACHDFIAAQNIGPLSDLDTKLFRRCS